MSIATAISGRLRGKSAAHLVLPAAVGVALCVPTIINAGDVAAPPTRSATGTVLMEQDFDGPAGGGLDPLVWRAQTNRRVLGNSEEIERNTASAANAYLNGRGDLVLEAQRAGRPGHYTYTSARYFSTQTFGPGVRIEARIKMAGGTGLWPNFWLMGGNPPGKGWPRTGEIDVAESIGAQPTVLFATPHGYSRTGVVVHSNGKVPHAWHDPTVLDTHHVLSDAFHTYALDWTTDRLVWSADGIVIKTFDMSQLKPGDEWSFDNPMHIMLTLAVGGFFAGAPTPQTPFPARMLIDYVRVSSLAPGAA